MKTLGTCLIAVVLLSLLLMVGCKKAADKNLADAQQNVVAAQQNVNDAKAQSAAVDEWTQYKANAEAKIAENDKIIADYKARMTNSKGKLLAKYDKKVDVLEQQNKDLKAKLDNYKDNGKDAWEKFKSEFDHDMDGLGTALKNFTVDNKK